MGFTLAEAQWLVKFMRNLPGQAASPAGSEEESYMQAMEMQAAEAQAAYGDYPMEEYYDEYW
jgi:hypothetical protein